MNASVEAEEKADVDDLLPRFLESMLGCCSIAGGEDEAEGPGPREDAIGGGGQAGECRRLEAEEAGGREDAGGGGSGRRLEAKAASTSPDVARNLGYGVVRRPGCACACSCAALS